MLGVSSAGGASPVREGGGEEGGGRGGAGG